MDLTFESERVASEAASELDILAISSVDGKKDLSLFGEYNAALVARNSEWSKSFLPRSFSSPPFMILLFKELLLFKKLEDRDLLRTLDNDLRSSFAPSFLKFARNAFRSG
ncbi:hypothetical protein OGATHE_005161 [Ogataea polymorpha]|uniref:Uncharacterized protein n=1 Tax=Ogataea polymorpha TaxID=460523 RepID=A0A9P8T057_9ASCO|nr:hypothetical protein OGATHE_005161 [Ogataea polymorpha]